MSREGEIRDMTHHAEAAHWWTNTLEEKKAAYILCYMCMHVFILKRLSVYIKSSDRAEVRLSPSSLREHILSNLFLPDLFYLWWSGRVNCCWILNEVFPCLSRPPLLFLSLVRRTRERVDKKARRWLNWMEKLLRARQAVHQMTPWQKKVNLSIEKLHISSKFI